MLVKINNFLSKYLHKLSAWRTNRKIIIFLSDDWGGVRIRSLKARQNLIDAGIDMDSNRFDRYDMLESNQDMEGLFEVLLSYKDHKGNHPVITAATNIANPDFIKIRESDFRQYFYEPFTKTLERYPNHDRVFQLYKKGIELKIFKPEYHGREHLQVKWWIENLQEGKKNVLIAFNNEYWYLTGKDLIKSSQKDLGAAYDFLSEEEIKQQEEILKDGVKIFNKLFGYNTSLFIPPATFYHNSLERTILDVGCKLIDVPRLRKMPIGEGRYRFKIHYLGQKSISGLRYIVRNAVFEPNLSLGSDGVDDCMMQIDRAFSFGIPAIISNHRAAFTGGLDPSNRDKGLKALNKLFKEILKRWPDVEFISASESLN